MLRDIARLLVPRPIWLRLALMRQRVALSRFEPYDAEHAFGGRMLRVHIADETGRRWYDHPWETPGEITLLSAEGQLGPGARVFDIGAHQAVVALMLSHAVGPEGEVIAVEPTRHNVRIAERNLSMNESTRVRLVHAAASDEAGEIRFTEGLNGQVARGGEPATILTAVTVDELTEQYGPPQVLFVDVEGFELQVLRGARQTLAESRPDLFVEVHAGGHGLEKFGTVDDLLALVPSGYRVLVSAAAPVEFRPLEENRRVLEGHSLMVALAPSPGAGA